MIKLRVEPSPRLRAQAFDPGFTTTAEDLPDLGEEWELHGIPRAGDEIGDPETGASVTVVRVVWWRGGGKPWLVIE